jgi:2'-hydroxyisoflavone reductase
MKLLFVGGTSFVGRHGVEAAVAAGHDVTVFHRGRTNAELLAGQIVHVHGDRGTGDYSALDDGSQWDAVVDVSAYVPRHVEQLADVVADRTGRYVHISSISAYDDAVITPDEDSALLADLDDPGVEDVTGETYGPLKAMCERAGLRRFGAERTAVIRPTYVAGPHDSTDRFTYWARRMARGGDVAVVALHAPLQVVDGRDLGAFMVRCASGGPAGAFDAVGPWAPLRDFLRQVAPAGVGFELVDVGGAALEASGIWLPLLSADPEPEAFMTRPGAGARAAGLSTRPLADTAEATRAWDVERGEPALKVGPSPDAEAELLAAAAG